MGLADIPREEWTSRLDAFTAMHEGCLVSLDSDDTSEEAIHGLPLIGISADRIDHDGSIAISVAASANAHVTRVIEGVTRVSIRPMYDGADTVLEMDADGTRTVVRLRPRATASID